MFLVPVLWLLGTTGAAGSNVPLLYSETAQAGSLKGQQTFDFKEEGTVNDSEQTGMDGSRHQGLRDELEVRLLNVEQESARVTSENATLKQLIMESRHKQAVMQDKMERILKTLYNVFMGGGNSNNLSISTNSAIVPAPTRSSLGPQMMENLLFRLDSLQSYGLR